MLQGRLSAFPLQWSSWLSFLGRRSVLRLVGVDFSGSSLKALELRQTSKGLRIEDLRSFDLPPETIDDKQIRNHAAFVGVLNELKAALGPGPCHVAFAMPDSAVITKVLSFEQGLSDHEIEQQIPFEADKYIPYPLEEVALDFIVLGPSAQKPEEQMDVLLVACRQEGIAARLSAFEEAGFSVAFVDVESYAIARAVRRLPLMEGVALADPIIASFDIGSQMTNMVIQKGDQVIFSREEMFGGDRLVRELQTHGDVDKPQVMKWLREHSWPSHLEAQVIEPFKESIVLQIRRSLQFFFSNSNITEMDQLVLAGGCAKLPGLAAMVAEQLSVRSMVAHPLADCLMGTRVDATLVQREDAGLLVTAGLAMRAGEFV